MHKALQVGFTIRLVYGWVLIMKYLTFSARIKLQRYCAFGDIPMFTERHCDLGSANAGASSGESRRTSACACSSSLVSRRRPSTNDSLGTSTASLSPSSPESSYSSSLSSNSPGCGSSNFSFPFVSNHSAKVCLKSALSIAHSFKMLP